MNTTLMGGMMAAMDGDGNIVAQEPSETYQECVRMSSCSLYVNRSLSKYLQEQLDGIREDAEKNPEKKDAYAMLAAATAQSLRNIKERGGFLEKRLEHALKNLKRKGLWADTLDGLDTACARNGLVQARGLVQVVRCCMGEAIASIAGQSELDDASWKIGIELAMSEHEPDIMETDSLFGPRLADNFPYIAANTLMAAYGAKLNQCLTDESYHEGMHDLIMQRYLTDPEVLEAMAAYVSHVGKDAVLSAYAVAEKARQQTDEEKQRADRLQEQVAELQKAGIPAQREIAKLQERNSQLEAELSQAKAAMRRYQEALEQRDRKLSELSPVQGGGTLLPLPAGTLI